MFLNHINHQKKSNNFNHYGIKKEKKEKIK